MRNLSRVCLLACGLLLSLASNAVITYEGPNDPRLKTYTWAPSGVFYSSGVSGCTGTAYNTSGVSEAVAQACVNHAIAAWSAAVSCGAHLEQYVNPVGTVASLSVMADGGTVYIVADAGCWTSANYMVASQQLGVCGTNRAIGTVGGLSRCVSTCYALKDAAVSAFVPIDDPAQSVPGACLLTSSNGVCELEMVDTSNYTYGTQLYRGGTWAYTGSKCTEDPTTAPTTGAVTSSPVGGTGSSGSSTVTGTVGLGTADAANLAATKTAAQSLATGQCGGTGQPKCGIEEFDTATVGTGTATGMAGQETLMSDALTGRAGAITTDGVSAFLPTPGRWLFSVDSFLPAASCSMDASFSLGTMAVPMTFTVCAWGEMVRAFFYWAFGLMTFYGIWTTLFRSAI